MMNKDLADVLDGSFELSFWYWREHKVESISKSLADAFALRFRGIYYRMIKDYNKSLNDLQCFSNCCNRQISCIASGIRNLEKMPIYDWI